MRLLEIKTADPLHIADKRHELKFHRNPSTPFAFFQHELLVLHADARHRFQRININPKRLGRGRRVLAKRVVRPYEIGRDPIVLHFDLHHFPALDRSHRRRRIVRVESEGAIRNAQIGRAHAGKRLPLRGDWRKICRDAVNIVGHAVFVQNLPECLAVPQLFGRSAAERNDPTPEMKTMLWAFYARRRKIKLKGFRIAVNEIKDSVPTGIHSRDQVRPCHRALRRDAGRPTPERPPPAQPGKLRHIALRPELPEQVWIEPVNTKDDQLPGPNRSAPSTMAAGKEAQTRGAQSQQAYQTKTFSEGRSHCKIWSGFLTGFLVVFLDNDGW